MTDFNQKMIEVGDSTFAVRLKMRASHAIFHMNCNVRGSSFHYPEVYGNDPIWVSAHNNPMTMSGNSYRTVLSSPYPDRAVSSTASQVVPTGTEEYSMAIRIKVTTLWRAKGIVYFNQNDEIIMGLYDYTGTSYKLPSFNYTAGGTTFTTQVPLINTWYQYLITVSTVNDEVILYRNTSVISSQSGTPPIVPPVSTVGFFGSFSFVNDGADSLIDDIKFWDKALTPAEVLTEYNSF